MTDLAWRILATVALVAVAWLLWQASVGPCVDYWIERGMSEYAAVAQCG